MELNRDCVDSLEATLLEIVHLRDEEKLIAPTNKLLGDIAAKLTAIMPDKICMGVLYTLNTDKPFFGIKVDPYITQEDALNILTLDTEVNINKYKVEFDSKLFDIGLGVDEIAAYAIYEISTMLSEETVNNVRALIDTYMITQDDVVSIRDSASYAALIIFALKDTFYKVSALPFKNNGEVASKIITDFDLVDELVSAKTKIDANVGDVFRTPNTVILQWMFVMYRDMRTNSSTIAETLKDAKTYAASKLELAEINKVLDSINHIDANIAFTEAADSMPVYEFLDKKGYHTLSEGSIFAGLKRNGLKSIEDAYYEFLIRAKNCETEEDAWYILRGINSRLSILNDYLYNTELSDTEYRKWSALADKYRMLREDLAKKKITNKKQYGIFIDYDKLDKLDDPNEE